MTKIIQIRVRSHCGASGVIWLFSPVSFVCSCVAEHVILTKVKYWIVRWLHASEREAEHSDPTKEHACTRTKTGQASCLTKRRHTTSAPAKHRCALQASGCTSTRRPVDSSICTSCQCSDPAGPNRQHQAEPLDITSIAAKQRGTGRRFPMPPQCCQ